jgi:phosphatidylglycerol:prolipoprotein diacylglycerol transferase
MHRIDPFLVDLSAYVGILRIRWYGMAYLAGAAVGYFLLRRLALAGRTQLRPEQVGDFVLTLLLGAFVGGRLGFCLFYEWRLFGVVDHFPYWGVLAVQDGGMSSHGGMIGCAVAGGWFARANQMSFLHLMDASVFAGSLGVVLGRIANFINGELHGRVCPKDSRIAVQFPMEIREWSFQELSKLADAAEAVGTPRGQWLEWLQHADRFGDRIQETRERLIDAVQSGNAAATEAMAAVLPTRYPSQLIQAVLEGLLVFAVLAALWTRPRKPGVVGAWWVILYATARIVGEQFREPDRAIGFERFGLTRGQWLSLAMLGVGVALLAYATLRKSERMSGWTGEKTPPHGDIRLT